MDDASLPPPNVDGDHGNDSGLGRGHFVRPYALTGGRTRPTVDIPIEAQVTAAPIAAAQLAALTPHQRAIIEICERPLALAEIAAYTNLPLGVTRVLVADLREDGFVVTGPSLTETGSESGSSDIALLERVLNGLRSL
jgi:hypothetical protein